MLQKSINILILLCCTVALAEERKPALEIAETLLQGGLLVGQASPEAQVQVDGETVRVSAEGHFLVAAGRDRPNDILVKASLPTGGTTTVTVRVKARTYDIQRIDGLPPSQVTPPQDTLDRIRQEAAQAAQARKLNDVRTDFLGGFVWPALGPISGVYGSQRVLNGQPRRPHFGVDVAAPTGTAVVAPAAGVVTLAHADMYYSGGTLILDHGHGLSSTFLHLSKLEVKEGDRISQGQLIARIGATGRVTGAHLDWRMNLFRIRIDPQLLVPPMPDPQ